MKRPNLAALEATAEAWNNTHPVRTPVTRYALINPLREPTETRTRSQAWVMGGHSVMVLVEGVAGGVLLESVVPIKPATAAKLAEAARGVLSMSGMKHPDGHYTLGETGHFQSLQSALNEIDRQNACPA